MGPLVVVNVRVNKEEKGIKAQKFDRNPRNVKLHYALLLSEK